jgi:hypothetical protein
VCSLQFKRMFLLKARRSGNILRLHSLFFYQSERAAISDLQKTWSLEGALDAGNSASTPSEHAGATEIPLLGPVLVCVVTKIDQGYSACLYFSCVYIEICSRTGFYNGF